MCSLTVVNTVENGGAVQFELLDDPKGLHCSLEHLMHSSHKLTPPTAIHVGSVRIDELFEYRAQRYLTKLYIDDNLVKHLADRMRKGQFQQLKIRFGTALDVPMMKIDVRGNSTEVMELSQ